MAQQADAGVKVSDLEWTYGDRLRKARRRAGIGVGQMGRILGRDRNTISRYESSKEFDPIIARAYAHVTGAPFSWLEGTESDGHDPGAITGTATRGQRGLLVAA